LNYICFAVAGCISQRNTSANWRNASEFDIDVAVVIHREVSCSSHAIDNNYSLKPSASASFPLSGSPGGSVILVSFCEQSLQSIVTAATAINVISRHAG
jgi:hypothetical protein